MRASLWLLGATGCLETLDLGTKETASTGDTGAQTPDDTDTTTTRAAGDELDCEADYATPSPGGELGACLTQEISCGEVIYGTLDGGSSTYDYDYWLMVGELDALLGEYDALDGPERVYAFRDRSVEQSVRVTVHSCFDHWATWILRGDYCDTVNYETAGVFEGGTGQRLWYTERLDPDGQYDYEFVIEGLYGAVGNYVITVECF